MKRSSYLRHGQIIELGRRPVKIWGYGRSGKYVCRVEINGAGLAVYSGKKGGKRLADASWETLVKRLAKKKEAN